MRQIKKKKKENSEFNELQFRTITIHYILFNFYRDIYIDFFYIHNS